MLTDMLPITAPSSGDGSINPVTIYEPTAINQNMANVDFPTSLKVGKIYIATYQSDNTNNVSINGGDLIYEEIDNYGSQWNNVAAKTHVVIFKATASIVRFTSSSNRMFSMTLTQLN